MFNYKEFISQFSEYERKIAPQNLYYEGDISLLTESVKVAVVGSRKPTKEGIIRAKTITKALVQQGITVVSGLAEGIDTIAHETAIANGGRTITCLGTPLNVTYPKSNTDLLLKIKKEHLAISQFPSGYPLMRQNFPQRNKTMALFSDATIIVEASENSGTRHQGWEALKLGRILFIMQNVAENDSLIWPKEMMKYGAQILKKDDLVEVLSEIPGFISSLSVEL